MKTDSQHVNPVREGFPKDSSAVSVRGFVLFLLVIGMAYFFIWAPWRSSRANFLLFLGFGMIQIAAVYSQDLHDSVMALDAPPLFMNPFMLLFVTGLALLGFAIELIIGARAKAWWEAVLLPIPPIVLASYCFRRTNPVPPFFVGLVALLVALTLKIM